MTSLNELSMLEYICEIAERGREKEEDEVISGISKRDFDWLLILQSYNDISRIKIVCLSKRNQLRLSVTIWVVLLSVNALLFSPTFSFYSSLSFISTCQVLLCFEVLCIEVYLISN